MDELKTLFIIAFILLILLLILQIRLRVVAEFGAQGTLVRVGIGSLRFTVYPLREKKTKPKRNRRVKNQKAQPQDEKETEGMSLSFFREILDLASDSVLRVRSHLQIDYLFLRLDWGLEDPADAAVYYGYANAVLSRLLALLEVTFKVKKKDAEIRLDYTLEKPKVYAKCSCSLRVRQALSLGFIVGLRGLRLYRSQRKQSKKTETREMMKQK